MSPAKPTTTPKYRAIADDLLELITSGKVGPGERLPKEAELVDRYKASRPTVRQAYRLLIDSGHVLGLGLAGYFVREVEVRRWLLSSLGRYVDPWTYMAHAAGGVPREKVTIELVTLDDRLSDWFEARPGDSDEFVTRSALRTLDNEPVQLAATYLPLHVAEGTALRRPESLGIGVVAYLVERCGEDFVGVTDTYRNRVATDQEAHLLELQEGSMVTEVVRQARFTPGQKILVVERLVVEANGGRFEHDVRLKS